MKARYLKQGALDELRANISRNLEIYRSGTFNFLTMDFAFSFEHDIDIDVDVLTTLRAPAGNQYFEAENCTILYATFKELSPYEARDERLWAYLSHTLLHEHGRIRWPIPVDDEEAVRHITKHFFAREKRQIERDNIGSRLWWMAHLCARITALDQEAALKAFLYRSDVRASLVERPTTSQAPAIFGALLDKLVLSYKGEKTLFQRNRFQHLMKEVNSLGGYSFLDCLPAQAVESIVSDIILKRLGLTEL